MCEVYLEPVRLQGENATGHERPNVRTSLPWPIRSEPTCADGPREVIFKHEDLIRD